MLTILQKLSTNVFRNMNAIGWPLMGMLAGLGFSLPVPPTSVTFEYYHLAVR